MTLGTYFARGLVAVAAVLFGVGIVWALGSAIYYKITDDEYPTNRDDFPVKERHWLTEAGEILWILICAAAVMVGVGYLLTVVGVF